jgi:hypothetical protein
MARIRGPHPSPDRGPRGRRARAGRRQATPVGDRHAADSPTAAASLPAVDPAALTWSAARGMPPTPGPRT